MSKLFKRYCNYCGKYYEGYGKYFCSKECYFEYQAGKHIKVKCQMCGKEFLRYKSQIKPNGIFCSKKCFDDYQRIYKKVKIRCGYCEKEFIVPEYQKKNGRKYCSYECAQKASRKSVIVKCAYCSKKIRIPPWRYKRNKFTYCSRDCEGKHYSLIHIGENHPNWKGGLEMDRGENWEEIAHQIRKRDGYKCVICGAKDKTLNVHHITPYRYTQDNSPNNLVTLCPSCHAYVEQNIDYSKFWDYVKKREEEGLCLSTS